MMKINQIWEDLENDKSYSHGLILRRYSSTILPDVFIALYLPEKYRCIATSISTLVTIDLVSFVNLKDVSIERIPDETKPENNILLIKLLSNQHTDIFSVLCEDLISSISAFTDEKQLIKELLNRFEKWKSLFDKSSAQGLSEEEQRGLYGELFYLRKFLKNNSDNITVINSWVGCEKQIRDFQHGSWGVEVKTTHGNNHQKVHISNERQLDTTNLVNLFLYHVSLEVNQHLGETLNQIVDSVSEMLRNDFILQNRFKNKLLEAGYFDQHRHLYLQAGYFIRQDVFYKVENDFPRIEERDIRRGVGDLQYSIVVSQCSDYIRNEEEVFILLNSNE